MTNLEIKRRKQRAASARCYRKKADALRALGLCVGGKRRGLPLKIQRHYFECHGAQRRKAISAKRRQTFVAQGLTTKGTIRKVQLHHLPRAVKWENIRTAEERKAFNANAAARQAIYRARRIATGLTSKGKPRRDGLAPRTALELAWRELRNTIQIPESPDFLSTAERAAA